MDTALLHWATTIYATFHMFDVFFLLLFRSIFKCKQTTNLTLLDLPLGLR